MEESTTWANRSAAPSLTLEDLEQAMEQWRAMIPAEAVVCSWVVSPDLMEEIQRQTEEAADNSVRGLLASVRASEFLEPGYAIGRDAEGNVVTILGPEKTIILKAPGKRFWER